MAFLLVDVFQVFGSGVFLAGVFLVCLCFFLGLAGHCFTSILSCLPPPLSVGAGLGNRVTHLWHRARFQSCRLGFGVVLSIFRVIFLLVFDTHLLFAFPRVFCTNVLVQYSDGFMTIRAIGFLWVTRWLLL